jgi:hypothetical protein
MSRQDLDLQRLSEIGDPFAEDAAAPPRPMVAASLPPSVRSSPTRERIHALRVAALVLTLLFEGVWLLRSHRPDLGSAPVSELLLGVAIPLAAALLALGAAVRIGPRGLGLPAKAIAALAVFAPLVFAVGTTLAAPASPPDPDFWLHAYNCFATTAFLVLAPLAAASWAYRHAFPTAAPLRMAAMGAASGALAAATISLACPDTQAAHVIIGHGTMILLTALAGAMLAPAVARS